MSHTVKVFDLGLIPYDEAVSLQRRMVADFRSGADYPGGVLLLCEHPPTITLGRRSRPEDLLVSPHRLAELGVVLRDSVRGGRATCHEPGQLVAYPILPLREYRKDVGWYLRSVEEVVIRALSRVGVEGKRVEGRTGIWCGGEKKIGAIGVAIRRWVSYHGVAVNVCNDLATFDLIVPCGLRDASVTSVSRMLGRNGGLEEFVGPFVESFAEVFCVQVLRASIGDVSRVLDREKDRVAQVP